MNTKTALNAHLRAERCWYCRERPAELWCDYMLGAALAPDRCEWDPRLGQFAVLDQGCKNRATWIIGADGYARTCDSCATAPALRRFRSRKRIENAVEEVATCDAAACLGCARQHGWRRRGHICCSPRSKSTTIDHCHVHAQAEGLGSSDWVGGPAIDLARREVRAACARATMKTCPKEQTP